MDKEIKSILENPAASNWLKENIRSAFERGVVEASYDAALLAKILGEYLHRQDLKRGG